MSLVMSFLLLVDLTSAVNEISSIHSEYHIFCQLSTKSVFLRPKIPLDNSYITCYNLTMIDKLDKWLQARQKERVRRTRISHSLKSYYATKRSEEGYHRVRSYLNGKYEGTYLLPNL